MAERTLRVCDLCLEPTINTAVADGTIAWRGIRSSVDVCEGHLRILSGDTNRVEISERTSGQVASKSTTKRAGVRSGGRKKAAPGAAEVTPALAEETKPLRRSAAKRVGAKRTKSASTGHVSDELTPSPATIRVWARAHDIPVSKRGGISSDVLSAFYEAHPNLAQGGAATGEAASSTSATGKSEAGANVPMPLFTAAETGSAKPQKRVTAKRKTTKRTTDTGEKTVTMLAPSPSTIRAWARAHSIPVSQRGGISADVLSAFYEAHPDFAPEEELAAAAS